MSDFEDESEKRSDPALVLRRYWDAVYKGRWVIVLCAVAGLVGTAVWTFRQPKIYSASTSIVIEPSVPQVLSNVKEIYDIGAQPSWYGHEFYETQFRIILSRDTSRRVVQKLGLDKDLDFLGLDGAADRDVLRAQLKAADPVARLQGMIHIEPVRESKIVNIIVEATDPRRATRLSNAVAEEYIELNLDAKLSATRDAALWLEDQLKTLRKQMLDSETALFEFKRARGVLAVPLEDQLNMLTSRLKTLNESLSQVQVKRLELAARRKSVAALKSETSDPAALQGLVKNEVIVRLRESLIQSRQQLVELEGRYEDKWPPLIAARKQYVEIEKLLDREMESMLKSIDGDFRAVVENERTLKEALDNETKSAMELQKLSIEYGRMRRESDNNQSLYGLVLNRLKEADLTGLLRNNNIRKLDAALVPTSPVRPRVQLNLVLGLGLGLAAGLGLAFLLNYLDNTVKSQDDVEALIGLTFLGMIPSISDDQLQPAGGGGQDADLRSKDLYVITHPQSTVAECHRSLRTNITFMSPERPLRRIVVTSAGPREGKSTTALGLALTMAHAGQRVLLIDTDMRRPRLHRAIGVSNERGVSNLIVGECAPEDAIKHTEIRELDVLPCGPTPPNPAELLHSTKFAELLDTLSARYDRIILDSPPVIAVTDAMVLSRQADGTLLVVKAGVTSRDMVIQAKRRLQDVKANILGVVLNDVNLRKRIYGYYYYKYYRRHGEYYGKEARGAEG